MESGRVGDVADASPRYGATLFCRRLLGISTKGPSVSDVNDVTKAGHDRSRWSASPLTRGDSSRWHLRAPTVLNLTPITARAIPSVPLKKWPISHFLSATRVLSDVVRIECYYGSNFPRYLERSITDDSRDRC